MSKPAPVPDEVTGFYWSGAAEHRLLVQRCASCSTYLWPPTVVCDRCHSRELVPTEVSGRGTVYSSVVMHQAFLPAFADDVPFALALIDLDDAPRVRMLTNVVDTEPANVAVGDPVEVVFETRGDTTIPQFRPAAAR